MGQASSSNKLEQLQSSHSDGQMDHQFGRGVEVEPPDGHHLLRFQRGAMHHPYFSIQRDANDLSKYDEKTLGEMGEQAVEESRGRTIRLEITDMPRGPHRSAIRNNPPTNDRQDPGKPLRPLVGTESELLKLQRELIQSLLVRPVVAPSKCIEFAKPTDIEFQVPLVKASLPWVNQSEHNEHHMQSRFKVVVIYGWNFVARQLLQEVSHK